MNILKRLVFILCITPITLGVSASDLYTANYDSTAIKKEGHNKVTKANKSIKKLPIIKQIIEQIDKHHSNKTPKYDTTYIYKPQKLFTFKTRCNFSSAKVKINGTNEDGEYRSVLESQMKSTISFVLAYNGISVSLAVNPLKLAGKYKDTEFNIEAYGNRMGVDGFIRSSKTLSGSWEAPDGSVRNIGTNEVEQKVWSISGYYVFNHRKFSLPAVYTQSYIQRRSAGSILLGLTWYNGNLYLEDNENRENRLKFNQIGIGVGYGYNLVLGKGWLLHLSSIPHLVLYNHVRLISKGEKQNAPFKFPNIIAKGRLAVIRNHKNMFYGLTATVNNTLAGDREKVSFSDIRWIARAVYGFRF